MLFANVSTVLTAAVDDQLITKNPCKAPSVSRRKVIPKELRPWTRERVIAVRTELPEQFRLVVWLGAGLGLRHGEIFGLSPSDIDFERGEVHVQRQVKVLSNNRLLFSLPKGGKTRKVPLPDRVHEAITAHMTSRPPVDVTLPWATHASNEVTEPLLKARGHGAMNRNYFTTKISGARPSYVPVCPLFGRTGAMPCGTSIPARSCMRARPSPRSPPHRTRTGGAASGARSLGVHLQFFNQDHAPLQVRHPRRPRERSCDRMRVSGHPGLSQLLPTAQGGRAAPALPPERRAETHEGSHRDRALGGPSTSSHPIGTTRTRAGISCAEHHVERGGLVGNSV